MEQAEFFSEKDLRDFGFATVRHFRKFDTSYKYLIVFLSSPHPYLFFNSDHHSLTFLGFNIAKWTYNMIDAQTNITLEEHVMTGQLYRALTENYVPLQENFDQLER